MQGHKMERKENTQSTLEIIYDGECPICNHYACLLTQENNVTTIDGRKSSERLQQAEDRNINIDKGAIVYTDGEYLFGTAAFEFVANNIEGKGVFGFLNRTLFRHHLIAVCVYPVFVFARRVYLRLTGKSLINE